MKQEVVIDCPHCAVRVKTETNTWIGGDIGFFLVQCPSCECILFGSAEQCINDRNQVVWDTLERLWPKPSFTDVGPSIPDEARKDIIDAQKCLSHGISSAAVVLCGRALERLIKAKAGNYMVSAKPTTPSQEPHSKATMLLFAQRFAR